MNSLSVSKGERSQLVTFLLGREIYGIDIFNIQEVLHFQEITSVPNAPEFVEGIIEVRGQVIPVVDLKKRLGISGNGAAKKRIVILDLVDRCLGVIVDDISKVFLLDETNYEALPEAVVDETSNSCIARLARTDDGLIIVVAPERILTRHEREVLKDFEENREQEQTDDVSSHATS